MAAPEAEPPVRIWDRPVRIIHWLIVLLLPAAWWTGEQSEHDWHYRIGGAILGLLAFRLIWGFIGSSTALFSRFVRGPRAILDHVRGRSAAGIGHNPLGALSVLALLLTLLVHVSLGLVSVDEDGIDPAPLSHLVSYDVAETAQELHEKTFDLLLVLIGLHLAAILYYAVVRRRNLVGPMITGRGPAPVGTEPMRPVPAWRALVALALSLLLLWWIFAGA